MTTQTIRLLFLPPLSPPKVITQELQEPSAIAGEDKGNLLQSIGTPLAREIEEAKQEEEKEEKKDEEESTIQTLFELPKIGTPTKTLQ